MNPPRRRRSLRLKGYDYSQPGAYSVTICTHGRACLFGEVVAGEMRWNQYGRIVCEEWLRSAKIRSEIGLHADEFVVMPNHVHGIVWIMDNVGATGRSPLPENGTFARCTPGPAKRSLASFVAGFKSAASRRINACRGTPGAAVWQRNYYEHVIRNDESLDRIRRYIAENPLRWDLDRENPNWNGEDVPCSRMFAARPARPERR